MPYDGNGFIEEDMEDGEGLEQTRDDNSDFENKYRDVRQLLYDSNNIPSLIHSFEQNSVLKHGRSLLHVAIENSQMDMTNFLFSVGCDLNIKENIGLTPLCIAVTKANFEVAKYLLDNGADCKCSTPSAYDMASKFGQNEILSLFDDSLASEELADNNLMKQCSINVQPVDLHIKSANTDDQPFSFPRKNLKSQSLGTMVPKNK